MKTIHGEPTPFHVKHGLSAIPPIPCAFTLGQKVVFTNDAGLKFERTVRAFSKEVSATAYKGFIYIFADNSSWWFPVLPESLSAIS